MTTVYLVLHRDAEGYETIDGIFSTPELAQAECDRVNTGMERLIEQLRNDTNDRSLYSRNPKVREQQISVQVRDLSARIFEYTLDQSLDSDPLFVWRLNT